MTQEKQKTLKGDVHVSGVGLHTGKTVNLVIKPAPADHWYRFLRTDIDGAKPILAIADNVIDTARGTSLGYNGIRVNTVEHVLASLAGLGIDNALIEVDAEEMPILDGSAKFIVEAIEKIGTIELDADRVYYQVPKDYCYVNGEKKVEIIAARSRGYKLSVLIDYDLDVLPLQFAQLKDISNFKTEIAPCRTFVFWHELEQLLKNNLIKGGDMKNAIIFVNKEITDEELERLAVLFNKPSVDVSKEEGILNNVDLYFKNEPARHKMLDLIGDLTLVGCPIKAHVIASRPGHESNVEMARTIRKQMLEEIANKDVPQVDFTATPLYDINQIKNILPHRPPFLLIDKIMEMGEDYVIGVKNVTMNEEFFNGHFPHKPVMPGVLQIEAMAQCGGILALSKVPDPENYLTYFLKIDNVKFRQQVVPGDTLVFKLELIAPIRRGLVNMKGTAYVGNTPVIEAEMLAQLSKVK